MTRCIANIDVAHLQLMGNQNAKFEVAVPNTSWGMVQQALDRGQRGGQVQSHKLKVKGQINHGEYAYQF